MKHEPTRMELFDEAFYSLPKIAFTPAPWKLALTGVTVVAGNTRIRQKRGEGVRFGTAKINARLIAASPTLYNVAVEAIFSLVELTDEYGPTKEQAHTMTLLVETIAWIHNDPRRGADLLDALELQPSAETDRPNYGADQ